jgi:hypothetical protein
VARPLVFVRIGVTIPATVSAELLIDCEEDRAVLVGMLREGNWVTPPPPLNPTRSSALGEGLAAREALALAACRVVGDVVDDVDVGGVGKSTDAQLAVPVRVEGCKRALWVWEAGGRREHLDDLREG